MPHVTKEYDIDIKWKVEYPSFDTTYSVVFAPNVFA